jgi:hypothetical protein
MVNWKHYICSFGPCIPNQFFKRRQLVYFTYSSARIFRSCRKLESNKPIVILVYDRKTYEKGYVNKIVCITFCLKTALTKPCWYWIQGDHKSLWKKIAQNIAQPILSKLMHKLNCGKKWTQMWATYFSNFQKQSIQSNTSTL